MKDQDVYHVILNDERFSVLADILTVTGIGGVLESDKSVFTFFAPTDIALSQLSASVLDRLKSPQGNRLAAGILGRYIVPGLYLYSDDLRHLPSVRPLGGRRVKINIKNNAIRFGQSPIRTPGIAARNGVIFPIDAMVLAQHRNVRKAQSRAA